MPSTTAASPSGYSVAIAKPASAPAAATSSSRGGPARSRQRTANAAKASIADITCEKNSVENGRISVPAPSATAAAVP